MSKENMLLRCRFEVLVHPRVKEIPLTLSDILRHHVGEAVVKASDEVSWQKVFEHAEVQNLTLAPKLRPHERVSIDELRKTKSKEELLTLIDELMKFND